MFEVPQRQQLKSIHRLLNVPPVATVKLGNAYQFEKFGTGNSLLRYGWNIRYRKRPPTVRDAFSKARETADSTDCGQPPGVRDTFSRACRAKRSTCRSGCRFSARNAHRSEVSKYKSG